jgi:hypothetical protein
MEADLPLLPEPSPAFSYLICRIHTVNAAEAKLLPGSSGPFRDRAALEALEARGQVIRPTLYVYII